jgi:hypothetical protein
MATEKQMKAWSRVHTYDGHGYQVKVGGGMAAGYFNSLDGEAVSRFGFQYDPFAKAEKDPDSASVGHGWLGVLGTDSTFVEVPAFDHPNDLYQWLREEFGYPRTIMSRAA